MKRYCITLLAVLVSLVASPRYHIDMRTLKVNGTGLSAGESVSFILKQSQDLIHHPRLDRGSPSQYVCANQVLIIR